MRTTRRRLLTLAGATTVGGIALAHSSDNARITVTREQIQVNANVSAEGGVTVQEEG